MTRNPDEDPGLERACGVPGEPVPPSHSFLREPTAILTHGVVTLSDLRLQESENSRSEVLKQACKWGRNTAGPGGAEDGAYRTSSSTRTEETQTATRRTEQPR